MSSRRGIRSVARYIAIGWGLLIAWVISVLLVRWYLNHHRFQPNDPRDARLLFAAAVVISISVAYMLVKTRPWTIQALGVLGLISFDAALYGLTSQYSIWRWHEPNDSDLNLLRAMLLVSAPLLALSHIWNVGTWARDWWRRRLEERR